MNHSATTMLGTQHGQARDVGGVERPTVIGSTSDNSGKVRTGTKNCSSDSIAYLAVGQRDGDAPVIAWIERFMILATGHRFG